MRRSRTKRGAIAETNPEQAAPPGSAARKRGPLKPSEQARPTGRAAGRRGRLDHHLTRGRRDGSRQLGRAGEVRVDTGRTRPALGDGPDDQRLPSTGIPTGEDPVDVGRVVLVAGDIAPLVQGDAELSHHGVSLRPDETHRQQYELGRYLAL